MSLLWLDGFESYGTTLDTYPAPSGILGTKYLITSALGQEVKSGAISGNSMRLKYGDMKTPFLNLDDTDDTFIVGFNFRHYYWYESDHIFLAIFNDTDWGGILYLEEGRLIFRSADDLYTFSEGLDLRPGVWYYLEMKLVNHDSAGTFEVRINGVNVFSGTGVDTRGGSATYYNVVKLYGGSPYFDYDDLYICNSAGTINNDFLGPIVVKELRPGADDTNNFATASPSSNHYENVDEAESDENTSYNQESTTGALEMYDYNNLSGVNAVIGVVTDSRLRTNSGVDEYFQHSVESGTTIENSGNVTTSVTSFQTYTHAFEKDPDTSAAWTVSGVNAATFGIELQ